MEWTKAARVFWPQTVFGAALTAWILAMAPGALWIAAPMLIAMTLAVPIAVITTLPGVSQWSLRNGLFDIP